MRWGQPLSPQCQFQVVSRGVGLIGCTKRMRRRESQPETVHAVQAQRIVLTDLCQRREPASRGIGADRLNTVSYGEERPKHDNAREETRRLNRRAALVVRVQR